MQSLLNELKRRNVFRATTSYTIVAWVLIQAASVVLPAFEAPDWILKVLLLFMAAGFPMVVLLAWVYELTPEGIQRTPEADDGRQPGSSRAFDSVLIVGLILALIITTTGKYLPNAFSSASAAVVQTVGKSATPEDPVRMAVMPFVTVNTSPEVSALAAGFSESIRGFLEDHTKLVVAGAASSLKAAMDHKTRVQIGQELDVQYLLEGTLRINNNQVHVFVQLVNVPDGKAVWSRDVERGRDQLESIEASIVTGVSDRFDMSVTGRQQSMLAPAMFADWEQVLGLLRGGDQKSLERARTLAKSITQHVPKFGPAHAALAFILCADRSKGNTAEFDDRANTVGGLLDDAMAEAPRDRRVLLWRARSQSLIERWRGRDDDFQRINAQFEDALSIFPGDSDLLTAYAEHRYAWGDTHRAIALANRALKNDPMSPAARKVRIASLIRSGQYDMASAAIAKLESGDLKLRLEGKLAVAQGHLHKALDAYDKMTGAGAKAPLEAARVWSTLGDVVRANQVIDEAEPAPRKDIWKLALARNYDAAYKLARQQLQPDDPRDAVLLGLLAVQVGKDGDAIRYFSKYCTGWVDDAGPLRGEAALQYSPWYAVALMNTGKEADARRLLDRHLAGVILIEQALSPAESGLYLAANFAVADRRDDAERALARAIEGGFRLTRGAMGGPVDVKESQLFVSLRRTQAFDKLM